MKSFKKYVAEFIGTLVLTLSAAEPPSRANTLLGKTGETIPLAFSTLLIAVAFGLTIVAMAYSVGNISGCHINPAVSIAMLASSKMSVSDFFGYIISQFLGAITGAAVLFAITGDKGLGSNGYGSASALGTGVWGALAVEIILTFVFVFAILGVTSKKEYSSVSGIVIGLTLTLVHILGIPFTGTSVNPARSFGPALIAAFTGNSEPLKQVWVFIVAPLIGAILAAAVYKLISEKTESEAK